MWLGGAARRGARVGAPEISLIFIANPSARPSGLRRWRSAGRPAARIEWRRRQVSRANYCAVRLDAAPRRVWLGPLAGRGAAQRAGSSAPEVAGHEIGRAYRGPQIAPAGWLTEFAFALAGAHNGAERAERTQKAPARRQESSVIILAPSGAHYRRASDSLDAPRWRHSHRAHIAPPDAVCHVAPRWAIGRWQWL